MNSSAEFSPRQIQPATNPTIRQQEDGGREPLHVSSSYLTPMGGTKFSQFEREAGPSLRLRYTLF